MSDLKLSYSKVCDGSEEEVAFITLARPEFANALSFKLMKEMIEALDQVLLKESVRVLVIRGQGKHFSAGADLTWMKASKDMTEEQNKEEATVLKSLFEKLYHFSKPTICVVRGAAYGGAVGLAACCDSVLAVDSARFCLSEVNLGLAPAVIYPYLMRRIRPGNLKRLSLTGTVFSGEKAGKLGLVDEVFEVKDLEDGLKSEISSYLSSAPYALSKIKELHDEVLMDSCRQTDKTVELIASLRSEKEAQHGLESFFQKTKPSWSLSLKEEWECDV